MQARERRARSARARSACQPRGRLDCSAFDLAIKRALKRWWVQLASQEGDLLSSSARICMHARAGPLLAHPPTNAPTQYIFAAGRRHALPPPIRTCPCIRSHHSGSRPTTHVHTPRLNHTTRPSDGPICIMISIAESPPWYERIKDSRVYLCIQPPSCVCWGLHQRLTCTISFEAVCCFSRSCASSPLDARRPLIGERWRR